MFWNNALLTWTPLGVHLCLCHVLVNSKNFKEEMFGSRTKLYSFAIYATVRMVLCVCDKVAYSHVHYKSQQMLLELVLPVGE